MDDNMERRKNYRFQAGDNTVAVWRNNVTGCIGTLLDISRTGVGIGTYIPGITGTGTYEMDIFISAASFRLEKLKTIFVSEVSLDDNSSSIYKPVRKCGFQFVDMTAEQKSKLDNLILWHTKNQEFLRS